MNGNNQSLMAKIQAAMSMVQLCIKIYGDFQERKNNKLNDEFFERTGYPFKDFMRNGNQFPPNHKFPILAKDAPKLTM